MILVRLSLCGILLEDYNLLGYGYENDCYKHTYLCGVCNKRKTVSEISTKTEKKSGNKSDKTADKQSLCQTAPFLYSFAYAYSANKYGGQANPEHPRCNLCTCFPGGSTLIDKIQESIVDSWCENVTDSRCKKAGGFTYREDKVCKCSGKQSYQANEYYNI